MLINQTLAIEPERISGASGGHFHLSAYVNACAFLYKKYTDAYLKRCGEGAPLAPPKPASILVIISDAIP
jgi:hypothetical protein